jgi:ACS family tartrate transporter-like MFS transporter
VCFLWGRHSDRTGDRKWHLTASGIFAAVGYAGAALAPTPVLQFAGICVGVIGIWSMFGVFWGYAGDLLGGAAAAGGLAFVNSLGSLGGVVGPWLLGVARQQTGNFSGSLFALAAFALITGLLHPEVIAPARDQDVVASTPAAPSGIVGA